MIERFTDTKKYIEDSSKGLFFSNFFLKHLYNLLPNITLQSHVEPRLDIKAHLCCSLHSSKSFSNPIFLTFACVSVSVRKLICYLI